MEDLIERPQQEQPLMPPPVPPQQVSVTDDIPPLKPNNWLWQSIVATVLCCLPFGIAGIIYAVRVDSLYYSGRYEESQQAAGKAKMWTIIAFAVGIVYIIVWGVMLYLGTMPEYIEKIIEENASGYNF